MDTLAAIGRWLSKQHVVTWCVSRDDELWCANAFYVYDPDSVAFYLLSDEHTRHGQMTGERAKVAGTVNGQPKNRGPDPRRAVPGRDPPIARRRRGAYASALRQALPGGPHVVGAGLGDSSGRNQVYRQHAGVREKATLAARCRRRAGVALRD